MEINNLFTNIPERLNNEEFVELFNNGQILIERIVSQGHDSDWFDQGKDEWVMLLQGEAILSFDNESDRHLKKGDYLFLPAHKKHRVKWTAEQPKTIWLAIHF